MSRSFLVQSMVCASAPTMIQRSKNHPYLWIRVLRYWVGQSFRSGGSICFIPWPLIGWFKAAKRRLGRGGEICPQVTGDLTDEEEEE